MDKQTFVSMMKDNISYTEEEKRKLLDASINSMSIVNNLVIVSEELSELNKEVCKAARGKEDLTCMLEEIADVEICLDIIKTIYHIKDDQVNKAVDVKLKRFNDRMKEGMLV